MCRQPPSQVVVHRPQPPRMAFRSVLQVWSCLYLGFVLLGVPFFSLILLNETNLPSLIAQLDFQAREFAHLIQDIKWVLKQMGGINYFLYNRSWISWTSSGHFVSLLRENESKNASRFLFPCKEPRAPRTALPQPHVWDPCSLVGSQAMLFTVHWGPR